MSRPHPLSPRRTRTWERRRLGGEERKPYSGRVHPLHYGTDDKQRPTADPDLVLVGSVCFFFCPWRSVTVKHSAGAWICNLQWHQGRTLTQHWWRSCQNSEMKGQT